VLTILRLSGPLPIVPFFGQKCSMAVCFVNLGEPLRGGWLPLLRGTVAVDMLEIVRVEYHYQIHTRHVRQELSSLFHHMG
jgi:hypothetical protein